jgi:hypothetical protein
MIFKGIVANQEFKPQLFDMFGKSMIINSLLMVEDSVKIMLTMLLQVFLDDYFKFGNTLIDQILTNLSETLKLSDDVEGSVIFVFNLIN